MDVSHWIVHCHVSDIFAKDFLKNGINIKLSIKMPESKSPLKFNSIKVNTAVVFNKFEPRHDKTNKMSVRPAKTQISLGVCPV